MNLTDLLAAAHRHTATRRWVQARRSRTVTAQAAMNEALTADLAAEEAEHTATRSLLIDEQMAHAATKALLGQQMTFAVGSPTLDRAIAERDAARAEAKATHRQLVEALADLDRYSGGTYRLSSGARR